MLSVKPLFQPSVERRIGSLNRLVSILLQGIALHSFRCDEAGFEAFQEEMLKLRHEIAGIDDEDSAFLLSAAAIRRLEEYTNSAEAVLAAHRKSEAAALDLVVSSFADLVAPRDALGNRLRAAGNAFAGSLGTSESAGHISELQACVEEIRLRALRRSLGTGYSDRMEFDGITGLPDARQAIDAITDAWDERQEYCAAVYSPMRLDMINSRFGMNAGDDALRKVASHIGENLSSGYRKFRWRGAQFLALADRRVVGPEAEKKMRRLATAKLEHTFTRNGHDVLFPIALTCGAIWLGGRTGSPVSIEAAIQKIDQLAVERLQADDERELLTESHERPFAGGSSTRLRATTH